MNQIMQEQLEAISKDISQADLPEKCKTTAAWCFGQLPKLYAEFLLTSESRFVEQITHLVTGMVKELHTTGAGNEQAQQLVTTLPERFRALHEEFGLPFLAIKFPGPAPTRPRKAS